MAFWGVEVKTGRPFTHSPQNVKGRLRISQATLGIGNATQKSLVQCNVGKKSPVLLCVLVPDKTESCHLDLEFEELDDVVFSVIGPRSVYLTGYYVVTSTHQRHNIPSDSESYGEDIANSDGLEHCSDEDDYEDSFIDDDDEPEVFVHSPVSSQSTEIETSTEHISKGRKLNPKRSKKRGQVIYSDDDIIGEVSEDDDDDFILSGFKNKKSDKNIAGEECDKPKVNFGGEMKDVKHKNKDDSGDEEIFTFAAFKNKNKADGQSAKPTVNFCGEVMNANNQSYEDKPDVVFAKNDQISEIDAVKCEKPKKKRKQRSKDVKNLETNISMNGVKEEHLEDKSDNVNQDPHKNINEQNPINEIEIDGHSADMGSGKSSKSKKRRRKSEKGSPVEGCPGNTDGPTKTDEIEPPNVDNVSHVKPDQPADAFISENKIKKKKKKKNSTTEDNGKYSDMVGNVAEKRENAEVKLFSDLVNKNEDLTTVSTLSNGLVVIELSKGKLEGKVAATGKKVKIQYTAMLKENGHVIDSNVGKNPYKFRLGEKDAIEGLHLGINGMRVGDKRKLIIPPSMGYGSQATGENVPPNSWLVYEVELLGISR